MKTKLIAEIGINHNGDLDVAKKLIDISSAAGCDFVKFQKRTVDLVYTKEELDKPRQSPWGTTNRQQKMGLEFSEQDYNEIDRYCKDKKIGWMASPWDPISVKFLGSYDCPYIKVASAMMTNLPVLEEIRDTGKPVILSTGMISEDELNTALDVIGKSTEYILACTSTYPSKVSDMNMRSIKTLQEKYGNSYKIGFSNHSPGLTFIYMAATLGAEMIEFHVTLDRSMYGSDQAASIEFPGIFRLVSNIKDIENSWGTGKIECLESEKPIREKLMGN
jgi:N-acetylneuraminate synthase